MLCGRWVKMRGGMPVIQVRDIAVQKRESDLVLATFGRGFYILDDYSSQREITAQALAEEARLFPLRDAYLYTQVGMAPAGTAGIGSLSGNTTMPNPPVGATFTYNVGQPLPADAKLVLTITDDANKQVRRMEVDKAPGLRRVTWNLRGDASAAGGQAGGRGVAPVSPPQGFLGRGGIILAPLVAPGRYTATLGRQVNETVTSVGSPQVFRVTQIPQQGLQLPTPKPSHPGGRSQQLDVRVRRAGVQIRSRPHVTFAPPDAGKHFDLRGRVDAEFRAEMLNASRMTFE